jgi:hypothetical protein
MKVIMIVFKEKMNSFFKHVIKLFDENKLKSKISNNPPAKNKMTNKLDISKIFVYSPKKKAAKVIAEYSTL